MKTSRRLLLLAVLMSAAFSAANLHKEFWYDEAYTLGHFVPRGFLGVFTDYHAPNNHMVFTFLLVGWMQAHLLLDLPEWCLRLLPWTCSVAAIACLYAAVESWRGSRAALWSALLLGTSHVFLNFSCQLRGYSLAALETSLSLFLLLKILERPTLRLAGLYALVSVLGVGTIPTNLLTLGSLSLWGLVAMALQGQLSPWRGRAVAATLCLAPPAGMTWYLWHPKVREQFFSHLPQQPPSPGALVHVWGEMGNSLLMDLFWVLPFCGVGLALLVFWPRPPSGHKSPRFGLSLMATLLPLFMILTFNPLLMSRIFFPLLPWWFALIGIAMDEACQRAALRWPRARQPLTCLLPLAILLAGYREVTFPGRYRERFSGERPQGIFYQYYQVDFHPHAALEFLSQAAESKPLAAFTDESDHYSLKFHAFLYDFGFLYSAGGIGAKEAFDTALSSRQDIYLVSNSPGNARSMLGRLTSEDFSPLDIHLALDTGYFKVYLVARP